MPRRSVAIIVLTWFGVTAPPSTPAAIVDGLGAIEAEEPSFREKLSAVGRAVSFKPPAAFAAHIAGESRKWGEIIPAMGIAVND
jgi:tripartite-type tricarboxylate transporter receptor subunit TctC